jgi:hypothetical protein
LIRSLQKRGNPRGRELHGGSSRLRILLGRAALHKEGEPSHDFSVELRDGPNPSVVLADYGGVLIWIKVEGLGDVYRVGKQSTAGLKLDQPKGRSSVNLAEGSQALRLDSEIAERNGQRGS